MSDSVSLTRTLTPEEAGAAPTGPASSGFGAGVWTVLLIYLLMLLSIGGYTWWRNRKQKKSLEAHYLANKGLGLILLAFSTMASLYSGYTVVGVPAESYGRGFFALRWVGCLGIFAVVILLLAPRLQYLSRKRGYISLLDFVEDRYNDKLLHILVTLTLGFPTMIYVMAQFVSFASTLFVLSSGAWPLWAWGVALAVILALFEIVGGLAAVALTDVLQGSLLLFGSFMVFILQGTLFKGMPTTGSILQQLAPELTATLTGTSIVGWFEFIIATGVSLPMFPHFQSRVMAAKNPDTFRRAFLILSVSPFLTLFPSSLVGLVVRAEVGDTPIPPNQVFGYFVTRVINENAFLYIIGSLMVASSVAAIMSTADSLLIAMSHLITVDVIRPLQRSLNCANEATCQNFWSNESRALLHTGKVVTVAVAAACVPFAAAEVNLSTLIGLQSTVMTQVSTVYLFGMYCSYTCKEAAFLGLFSGLAVSVPLNLTKTTGAPATIGLGVNIFVIIVATWGFHYASKVGNQHPTTSKSGGTGSPTGHDANTTPTSNNNLPATGGNPNITTTPPTPNSNAHQRQTDAQLQQPQMDTQVAAPVTKGTVGKHWTEGRICHNQELRRMYVGVHLPDNELVEPIHKWYMLLAILVFVFFGIPFYWPNKGEVQSLVGGFPAWTVVTLFFWGTGSVLIIGVAFFFWKLPDSLKGPSPQPPGADQQEGVFDGPHDPPQLYAPGSGPQQQQPDGMWEQHAPQQQGVGGQEYQKGMLPTTDPATAFAPIVPDPMRQPMGGQGGVEHQQQHQAGMMYGKTGGQQHQHQHQHGQPHQHQQQAQGHQYGFQPQQHQHQHGAVGGRTSPPQHQHGPVVGGRTSPPQHQQHSHPHPQQPNTGRISPPAPPAQHAPPQQHNQYPPQPNYNAPNYQTQFQQQHQQQQQQVPLHQYVDDSGVGQQHGGVPSGMYQPHPTGGYGDTPQQHSYAPDQFQYDYQQPQEGDGTQPYDNNNNSYNAGGTGMGYAHQSYGGYGGVDQYGTGYGHDGFAGEPLPTQY